MNLHTKVLKLMVRFDFPSIFPSCSKPEPGTEPNVGGHESMQTWQRRVAWNLRQALKEMIGKMLLIEKDNHNVDCHPERFYID